MAKNRSKKKHRINKESLYYKLHNVQSESPYDSSRSRAEFRRQRIKDVIEANQRPQERATPVKPKIEQKSKSVYTPKKKKNRKEARENRKKRKERAKVNREQTERLPEPSEYIPEYEEVYPDYDEYDEYYDAWTSEPSYDYTYESDYDTGYTSYTETPRDEDYRTEYTPEFDDANEYIQSIIDTIWEVKDALYKEQGWDVGTDLGRIAYELEDVLSYPYELKASIADSLAADRSFQNIWELLNYGYYKDIQTNISDIAASLDAIIQEYL